MAGIGWRLERLIDQQSLAGPTAAYAIGAAVMALPWVLTTAVLVSLPAVVGREMADFATAQTVVEVAFAVALLLNGPLLIVVSRYTADCVYEGRLAAIAAPFCRGLAAAFLIGGLGSSVALLAIGVPPSVAAWGGALSAAAGAQWAALSVGNGLCSPGLVLGALGIGAAQSFLLAAGLVSGGGLGVPGYVLGLVSGQIAGLAILLVGVLRALPDRADESARLLPAFRDYAPLAAAGFAYNASVWVDKLVAWCIVGGEAGRLHAAASTLAWFSTIPCLAWIFVNVETSFHRRFREFYDALELGAPFAELHRGVRALSDEAARLLRGAVAVQAGVTAFLHTAAGPWIPWLGLREEAVWPFRLLLLGAGTQALTLLGLILLYYFDLRRDALLAATSLLVGIVACTAAASGFDLLPSVGTAIAGLASVVLTWQRVFRGVRGLLETTLLGQP